MYQVLRDTIYGEGSIPEDLSPSGWTYWDETDCWYHAHGDTGIKSVVLVLGQTEQDAGHVYLRSCIAL